MYNLFDAFQRGVDECKKKRSKDLQNKRKPSTLLRLNNLPFHLFFIDIIHHPISQTIKRRISIRVQFQNFRSLLIIPT